MVLKNKELKLISILLELAAYDFDNHGCNDFNDYPEDWTEENKKQIYEDSIKLGLIGKNSYKDYTKFHPGDNLLMLLYSAKLNKKIKNFIDVE